MDRAGRTPLHYAALDDDVSAVLAILAGDAAPDAMDEAGRTPLHMAAQGGSVAAATALLDAGASVDPTDDHGNTPLWVALFAHEVSEEMIALLRSRGADPLHVNHHGKTPAGIARLIASHGVARFFTDVPEAEA